MTRNGISANSIKIHGLSLFMSIAYDSEVPNLYLNGDQAGLTLTQTLPSKKIMRFLNNFLTNKMPAEASM